MKIIKQVVSSQMKEVEYDTETKQLIVTFTNGVKYSYEDVPKLVFKDLVEADSVGSFFIKNIKNNKDYKYSKIG